jgi:uncharacterized LabA/DUF88 family protein
MNLIDNARVAIFIDGSNLYHALQNNFGRHDLNYELFTDKLRNGRRLYRTYYYNVLQDPSQRPEGSRDQQDFLEVLRKTPYLEMRLGGTKTSQGTTVEKGIDVTLATDLVDLAWRDYYDVALIVSGDADFAYAVQTVKNKGKHVEVAYFEGGVSRDMLAVADVTVPLNRTFFTGLWAGHRRTRRRRPAGNSGS